MHRPFRKESPKVKRSRSDQLVDAVLTIVLAIIFFSLFWALRPSPPHPLNPAQLNAVLARQEQVVRAAKAQQQQEHDRRIMSWMAESRPDEYWTEYLLPTLRPATVDDYKTWLAGYLSRDGNTTDFFSQPMPTGHLFLATQDMEIVDTMQLTKEHIYVIVPPGVHVTVDASALTNVDVFVMDGFIHYGESVPVFSDTRF